MCQTTDFSSLLTNYLNLKDSRDYCDPEYDTKMSGYLTDMLNCEAAIGTRESRRQSRAENRKERVEKKQKWKVAKIEKRLGLDPYSITIDNQLPEDSYVVIDSSGIVISNRIKIDNLEAEYLEKEKIFDAEVLANREYTNRCGNALKRMQEIRAEINVLKNNDSKI